MSLITTFGGMLSKEEFAQLPLISSFFPIKMPNGAIWQQFIGCCKSCEVDITDNNFKGIVTRPFDGGAWIVDAVGFCPTCSVLTGYEYRLMPNSEIVGISPQTGKWTIWGPKKSRFLRFLEFVGLA